MVQDKNSEDNTENRRFRTRAPGLSQSGNLGPLINDVILYEAGIEEKKGEGGPRVTGYHFITLCTASRCLCGQHRILVAIYTHSEGPL